LSPFEGWADGTFDWPVVGLLFNHGLHWFVAKVALFIFIFLWLRATFPRYRYDQIMRLGWKVFIPITIVWIVVTGIMIRTNFGWWWS
jgi:NADH-quinone oxidoreductase subunit H